MRQEYRVLNLNKCPKSRIIILNKILISYLLDARMNPGHRYVISNTNITTCIPTYLQISLVFRIQYEKDFTLCKLFLLDSRTESFKNYEVVGWTFYFDDVED